MDVILEADDTNSNQTAILINESHPKYISMIGIKFVQREYSVRLNISILQQLKPTVAELKVLDIFSIFRNKKIKLLLRHFC